MQTRPSTREARKTRKARARKARARKVFNPAGLDCLKARGVGLRSGFHSSSAR